MYSERYAFLATLHRYDDAHRRRAHEPTRQHIYDFMNKLHQGCAFLVAMLIVMGEIAAGPDTAWSQSVAERQEAIPRTVLAPVDVATLRAEDAETANRIVPQRTGVTHAVEITPSSDGRWTRDGTAGGESVLVWRHRITSPKAKGMSLRFDPFAPPPGATLRIYSGNGALRLGPYTAADATRGLLVTPVVHSDEVTVEVTLATLSANEAPTLRLQISGATHHYRTIRDIRSTAKSGSCNVDVACPEADPYRDLVRSVARISYSDGRSTFVCTGTLVNNTNLDGRPFFLTAEHCISDEETAATVVFYWNFENSTCRPPGSTASGSNSDDNPDEETSTGAILRARYGAVHSSGTISGRPDLALLEVDDPAGLSSFDVYYAGWDVSGSPPASGVSIHHPAGDAKRIAIDGDELTRTAYLSDVANENGTHWRIGDWETGTTERGSSGSFVVDENKRLVGVLSGGFAGCRSDGTDNDAPDWYGSFAAGFDETDFGTSTVRDWLDPAGTGTLTLNGDDLVNLPVDLVAFDVRQTTGALTATWTTASETNVAGFRLLIADKGASFSSVGPLVDARNTRSEPTTYRETIMGLAPGTYRVQLREVGLDGEEHDLGTQVARVRVDGKVFVQPVRPHPVTDTGHLRVVVGERQRVRLSLFDLLGRRVATLHDGILRADSPLSVGIDGSRLAAGTYVLRITGERFTRTERVVVAR